MNDLIRRARRKAGLSQLALARKARVAQSTVARIESGAIDPRLSTVTNLLQACGYRLSLSRLGEGVDRSLIAERLKLSPTELLDRATSDAAGLEEFLHSVRR
jgi:transcriptional regulator with XRE-family HTH domain